MRTHALTLGLFPLTAAIAILALAVPAAADPGPRRGPAADRRPAPARPQERARPPEVARPPVVACPPVVARPPVVVCPPVVVAPPSHHWSGRDRDRDGLRIRVDLGPRYEQRWVPGRYESRTEQVLVCEGRYETRWVPAVYETRYDVYGRPYTIMVREGCHAQVWVPPVYETRIVQVWVSGYWETVPVPSCGPRISIGGTIRF